MKAIDKHPVRLISIRLFLFSELPRIDQNMLYFGMSVGCLEDVWEVPRGCLSDSGCCQGGYDVQETNKHPIRLIFISLFLFFPVASDWSKYAIFWGVCRVSGRCLGGA